MQLFLHILVCNAVLGTVYGNLFSEPLLHVGELSEILPKLRINPDLDSRRLTSNLTSADRPLFTHLDDSNLKTSVGVWTGTVNISDPESVLNFLKNFLTPINGSISEKCRKDSLNYINTLNSPSLLIPGSETQWAVRMFDASAKYLPRQTSFAPPASLRILGSQDSCLKVANKEFKGKHCLFAFFGGTAEDVNQFKIQSQLSRMHHQTRNTQLFFSYLGLSIGRCIPSSCTETDLATSIKVTMDEVLPNTAYPQVLNCHTEDETVELDGADIFTIIVFVIFGILVVVGTLVDITPQITGLKLVSDDKIHIFRGLSIYTNTRKLFNTESSRSDSLDCIHGIRFLSMSWVIVSHCYNAFLYQVPLNNPGTLAAYDGPGMTMAFQVIQNGFPSVDSFFLIGATLLTYLTLYQLDKGKAKNSQIKFWIMYYVHRYIRLTGVYAIVILFSATLYRQFSTGPQSYQVDMDVESCQKTWWANLLYVNNLQYFWDKENFYYCVPQTWYLANDMQFFLISPLIIYPLWKFPTFGLIAGVGWVAIATIVPSVLAYNNDFPFSMEFQGLFDLKYFGEFYIVPWCRFQPYICGILLGFILHRMRGTKTLKINGYLSLWIWAIMGAVGAAAVYGLHTQLINYAKSGRTELVGTLAERTIYNGFHRLGWSIALGWVILACSKMAGGPINSILCWKAWIPLARLSYCMYLVHLTLISYISSLINFTITFSQLLAVYWILAVFMITVLLSYLLSMLFEIPLAHLEKLLFDSIGLGSPKKPADQSSNKPDPSHLEKTAENGVKLNGN